MLKLHSLKRSGQIAFALIILCLLSFGFHYGNWRIVNLNHSKVAVAPFGFSYDNRPFSGLVYRQDSHGQLTRLAFVLRGHLHLWEAQWYNSGQIRELSSYSYGLEHGPQKIWFPNGSPKAHSVYNQGKRIGESWGWYENGEVKNFALHNEGEEVIIRSFTSTDKPFHNYVHTIDGLIGLRGDRKCDPASFSRR